MMGISYRRIVEIATKNNGFIGMSLHIRRHRISLIGTTQTGPPDLADEITHIALHIDLGRCLHHILIKALVLGRNGIGDKMVIDHDNGIGCPQPKRVSHTAMSSRREPNALTLDNGITRPKADGVGT